MGPEDRQSRGGVQAGNRRQSKGGLYAAGAKKGGGKKGGVGVKGGKKGGKSLRGKGSGDDLGDYDRDDREKRHGDIFGGGKSSGKKPNYGGQEMIRESKNVYYDDEYDAQYGRQSKKRLGDRYLPLIHRLVVFGEDLKLRELILDVQGDEREGLLNSLTEDGVTPSMFAAILGFFFLH